MQHRTADDKSGTLTVGIATQGLAVEEQPYYVAAQGPACTRCAVHLQFHPLSAYPAEVGLTWPELERAVEKAFAPALEAAIVRVLRKASYTPGIETVHEDNAAAGSGGRGKGGNAAGNSGGGDAAGGDEEAGHGAGMSGQRDVATGLLDGDTEDEADENKEVCSDVVQCYAGEHESTLPAAVAATESMCPCGCGCCTAAEQPSTNELIRLFACQLAAAWAINSTCSQAMSSVASL